MTIRFTTDCQRAKVLKELHSAKPHDATPISREAIDFLFEYIGTLETELAHWSNASPLQPLNEAYYEARGTAEVAYEAARKFK